MTAPILPGDRIAWFSERFSSGGPTGVLDVDEGVVLLSGELHGGRGFWVAGDDGRRLLVQRSWVVPPRTFSPDGID